MTAPPPGEATPPEFQGVGPGVIPAKVGPPAFRLDTVHRPRLLDRLDASEARVVLVSAPAGAGKSVLALEWLRQHAAPVAWLSLDPLDSDPARFLAHLLAALTSGSPPLLPPDEAASIHRSGPGTPWAGPLLARLAGMGGESVVVLDDVHTLDAGPVLDFVDALLTGLRSGPRIVLLTRADPPIALGHLRLSGDLLELRQEDLRFTLDEVTEFFRRSLPFDLDRALVHRLEARTEGWAAGLRLTALALARAEDPAAAAEEFLEARDLIVEYLMEEAVGRQPEEIRDFLMDTAILPRFNRAACVRVTGDPRAGDRLAEVEDANLFLVALDRTGGWYRYHHLFGELLELRLAQEDPERLEALRLRASRWFEEEGDLQEALAQAARMQDRGRLLELLDRHGYDILARSEFAAYARWLPHLADPLTCGAPMFLASLAWFRAQTERSPDLAGLLEALDQALENPPPGYPRDRLREASMHRAVLRSFVLRVTDRFDASLESGRAALAELPADATRMRGILRFNMGAVYLRMADMEAAREHLAAAYEDCLGNRVPYLVLASLGHLGSITAQTTGLEAARRELEAAVSFAEDEGLDAVPAFGIVLYQLAHVHYLADALDPARTHLERALRITTGERENDIHANVLIHLAGVEGAAGRGDRADELLRRGTALALQNNVKPFATTLDVERARLAERLNGRLQPLEAAPASAEPALSWSSLREAEARFQLEQCLKLGHLDDADRLAQLLERESVPRRRGVALTLARLARAVTAPEAAERRRRAADGLRLAAARGYVRPVLDGGPAIHALLRASVDYPDLDGPAREFVRHRLLPRLPVAPLASQPLTGLPGEEEVTSREREILLQLSRGLTNDAIARELFVSVNTVKTHLKHIYAKLGASNRTEAVEIGRRQGVVPEGD
jgi:LuxR family maltose regulon positive regulatory protein